MRSPRSERSLGDTKEAKPAEESSKIGASAPAAPRVPFLFTGAMGAPAGPFWKALDEVDDDDISLEIAETNFLPELIEEALVGEFTKQGAILAHDIAVKSDPPVVSGVADKGLTSGMAPPSVIASYSGNKMAIDATVVVPGRWRTRRASAARAADTSERSAEVSASDAGDLRPSSHASVSIRLDVPSSGLLAMD